RARPARVPEAGRAALRHGRRDPRLQHGRRHRAGAGLPLPRGEQSSVHPHRPAGSEARHLSGLGRQRAPAAAGRRAGGDGHDAHRPRVVGEERRRDRPGGQGRGPGAAGGRRGGSRPARPRAPAKATCPGLATNWWPVRQVLAPILVKQVAAKAPKAHYPAPYALIETWRRAGGGIQALLKAERRAVAKLAGTDTARNLIRVFFLQEKLKSGVKESGIARVHVIGAGVMGGDIAAWSAYKGFDVTLSDREQRFIDGALKRSQALFEKKVKDPAKRPAVAARLRGDLAGDGAADADLVIEAIIEQAEAKRELYAAVEPRMPAGALLTSNTSSIPLTDLRGHLQRPAQF